MADITSSKYPVVTDSTGSDQYAIVRNGQLKKQTRDALDEHIADIAATDFKGLSDTPGTYVGQVGKTVAVNVEETGLEFVPNNLSPTYITLPDTPPSYVTKAGLRPRVNTGETALEFAANTFLESEDVPSSYSGLAGYVMRINAGETGLEFISPITLAPNLVYVTQASDLAPPLSSSFKYFIAGPIDMGTQSIEVPIGGLNLGGHSFDISSLYSTEPNYTMFVSPVGGSGDLLGMDYAVSVTGANSKVYDLTAATGNEAFEFERINYNSCVSLGEITGYRQGLESGTGRFGGTPELTLSGTWAGGYFIDISIVRGLTAGAYSLFKAGPGFQMTSRFRSNQNIDLPSTAAFFDFAPSNFVNPSTVQLTGCLISRNGVFDASDATIIPNMLQSDLVSEWTNNNGIKNTFVGGEQQITGETTTVVSVAATFYDLAGTYTTNDLQHFDSPASGQLRHLGESPVEYSITGQYVIESGSNDEVDLKIVIYRAATTSFEDGRIIRRVINNLQGGRNVAYFALSDNVTLNQLDYVKLQVANVADTDDITAELDSFMNVTSR